MGLGGGVGLRSVVGPWSLVVGLSHKVHLQDASFINRGSSSEGHFRGSTDDRSQRRTTNGQRANDQLVTTLVSRGQQIHIQPNRSRDAGGQLAEKSVSGVDI